MHGNQRKPSGSNEDPAPAQPKKRNKNTTWYIRSMSKKRDYSTETEARLNNYAKSSNKMKTKNLLLNLAIYESLVKLVKH